MVISYGGLLNFKLVWNQIRVNHPVKTWANIISNNCCHPKMLLYSVLAILNKLNTKDNISKWQPDINRVCVLCNQGDETHEHLFF